MWGDSINVHGRLLIKLKYKLSKNLLAQKDQTEITAELVTKQLPPLDITIFWLIDFKAKVVSRKSFPVGTVIILCSSVRSTGTLKTIANSAVMLSSYQMQNWKVYNDNHCKCIWKHRVLNYYFIAFKNVFSPPVAQQNVTRTGRKTARGFHYVSQLTCNKCVQMPCL